MKIAATRIAALIAAFIRPSWAGRCGTPLFEACIGASDPRYDPSASFDLKDQDAIWEEYGGYWIGTNENFAPDGSPRPPSPYNTDTKQGIPYATDVPFQTFVNRTVVGTRYHHHIAVIYGPAGEAFCARELGPGEANVIGTGTCGRTGHAAAVDVLGTSSYEKDASVDIFWWTNGQGRGPALLDTSSVRPVDDHTVFFSAGNVGELLWSHTQQMTTKDRDELSGVASFVLFQEDEGVSWNMFYRQRKVDEEEWLQELEEAYEANSVLEEDRLQIPLKGPCLRSWDCPIDELTWCDAGDPNTEACPNNVSPYQEPDAPMKTGAVVGFVILGAVLASALGYFLWRRASRRRKARYERLFVERIAKEVGPSVRRGSVGPSESELLSAFKRVDTGDDGYIQKEELRAFLSDGGVELDGRDFDLLFASMDLKGRGRVNFLDFCAYLGSCRAGVEDGAEGRETAGSGDVEERTRKIARQLSANSRCVALG
ncbi:hypothetical protein ACHAXT_000866 [Thalassiosira profunda]